MKKVLPWVSLVVAILVGGFAIYGFISAIGVETDGLWPEAYPLMIVSLILMLVGSILQCVGAFLKKKTLVIIGWILLIVGVALLQITFSVNSNYVNNHLM